MGFQELVEEVQALLESLRLPRFTLRRGSLNQPSAPRHGMHVRWKSADELLHRGVPEAVEAEEAHLPQGLFSRPFVHRHPVSGDKHSGAVVPKVAMHKNLLFRIIAKQFQKLGHLLFARRRPSAHRNVYNLDSESGSGAELPREFVVVFASQVKPWL